VGLVYEAYQAFSSVYMVYGRLIYPQNLPEKLSNELKYISDRQKYPVKNIYNPDESVGQQVRVALKQKLGVNLRKNKYKPCPDKGREKYPVSLAYTAQAVHQKTGEKVVE
jgi:hypothetical protein